VTGLTTPWNEDQPWTDNSWCMEVFFDPYTGKIFGEGTNIGMTVLKKYSGTLIRDTVDCHVHFPTTDQKSRYHGKINEEDVLNLRIEILDPGKTSGVKGDFKYASGKWVEIFDDRAPSFELSKPLEVQPPPQVVVQPLQQPQIDNMEEDWGEDLPADVPFGDFEENEVDFFL